MTPLRKRRTRPPRPGFPLTEKGLRRSFDPLTWTRAQDYVGAFYDCEAGPRQIKGCVSGHYGIYSTLLKWVGGSLECSCSCPAADDMDCKHAAALGLTYLREPASFRKMAASDHIEFRALASVSKLLKGTSLKRLVAQLRAHGITQKRVVEILEIQENLFSSAKRLEKRGRPYGFLNACKLACVYLLEVLDREGGQG